jgi:glutamine amidotransferase
VSQRYASRCLIGIVDYQAGNLQSINNAFEHLGTRVTRVTREADLYDCTHLVLPGVGAFGFCAERFAQSGLTHIVRQWAFEDKRPLLGICVGMQLLADSSEESQDVPGLGWMGGKVIALAGGRGVRIPHVGWNTVRFDVACGEFQPGDQIDFYFDHSFAYELPALGQRVASCKHGITFSAVIAHENVTAVQFHPEKSQSAGLRLLRGFLAS